MTCDRHCKKKLVNRTVLFENEPVPLNGRIGVIGNFSFSAKIGSKMIQMWLPLLKFRYSIISDGRKMM